MRTLKQCLRCRGLSAAALCFASAVGFVPLSALAQSPITMSHELTSYEVTNGAASASYTMTVTNPTDATVEDLQLTLVPRLFPVEQEATISFSSVGSHTTSTTILNVSTPMRMGTKEMGETSLEWIGHYRDTAGVTQEFPVQSYPAEEGVLP